MRDKVVRFGRGKGLVGILSEPASGTSPGRPGVILLNSGILHRVGACRLHVNLARELAGQGFTALRFDFSGIGDSEARKDDLSFEQSSIVEIGEAMDHLRAAKGIERFVLAGLCSGADMAHQTARQDPRVVGMALLDAWCYRTPKYYLHHYGKRIASPEVWKNFVTLRMRRLLNGNGAPAASGAETLDQGLELPRYVREYPPREHVAADLREFVKRDMDLFFIFSGGQEDVYNYRGQYEDTFRSVDFRGRLRVDFVPQADHIFTGLVDQQYVVKEISGWLGRMAASGARIPAVAPVSALTSAPARVPTAIS